MELYVRTFFAFYREAIKMEARCYREELDIAITPAMKFEYYKSRRDHYNHFIYPQEAFELPEPARGPVFETGSQDAENLLRNVVGNYKRSLGY